MLVYCRHGFLLFDNPVLASNFYNDNKEKHKRLLGDALNMCTFGCSQPAPYPPSDAPAAAAIAAPDVAAADADAAVSIELRF